MKRMRFWVATAVVASALGCGGSVTTGPGGNVAKDPTTGKEIKTSDGQAVSTAAANKFKEGLDAMAAHDKAGDWAEATCNSTAQLFLDAAKEQGGDKTFGEALYNAGLSYQRCKKDAEAKKIFQEILAKNPKFHRARVQAALYAFAESGEKNIEAAINEMKQAVLDAQFQNVDALVNQAQFLMRRGNTTPDNDGANDLERGKKNLQRALAVDDGYMPAFNQLAMYYLEKAKEKAGRKAGSKGMKGAGKEKQVDTQALELAALVCSQAIRKNPNYAAIHNTAGMIQVELKNLNSAVGEFNTARKLDPTFYEAQMNYAAVNLQFRGFAQADEAYRAALKMRPNDYEARLGLALAIRGQIDVTAENFEKMVASAEAELEAAKKIAPDRPEAYYNAAILTQAYKTKAGGKAAETALEDAKKLYLLFAQKAGSSPEFADAVLDVTRKPTKTDKQCMAPGSRKDPACMYGRVSEIDQIIEFNKQDEAMKKQMAAEAKQREAEAEAEEEGGAKKPGGEAPPAAEEKAP